MAPKGQPSYARQTLSSVNKNRTSLNPPAPPEETATTTSKTPTANTRIATATVRDIDFEETQLISRGVEIFRQTNLQGLRIAGRAFAHFNSDAPSDPATSRGFYRKAVSKALDGRTERGIDHSMFLSVANDFVESVHETYRILGNSYLPEPDYKTYAFQELLIGQRIFLTRDTTRQLCVVRSGEWSLKPRPSKDNCSWHEPPLLSDQPPSKVFGFDIHADCQFWLCIKILNADYRRHVQHVVHCKALGTFCPYFSVEFKARVDDTRVVENQVLAAGLISLFNRYQLKLQAHPHPTTDQLKPVRHYGMTMEKEFWKVWLFEPKTADGAWAGCTVRVLDSGNCLEQGGTLPFLQWINEIHRWGLSQYALNCEEDIEEILGKNSADLRMSLAEQRRSSS